MRRLMFVLLLLCVVATVGGWSLGATSAASQVQDGTTDGEVASVPAATEDAGDNVVSDPASPSPQPCIVRADCAGGGLLVGPPLLLVVVLPVLAAAALVPLGRVTSSVAAPSPALLATGLDRPPQLSS